MLIYFCLYAMLGYIMESTYRSVIEKRWISSGLLKCPFIPLYGFGAISLLIYDDYFQYNFLIGGLILIVIELVSSYFIEYFFKIKYWDYSHHLLNFDGRICLFYSIIWIIISYLFYYHIHPIISLYIYINRITYFIASICIFVMIQKVKKRISKNLS